MASLVTVGHLVKANEDAAIFDSLGNMNDWVEIHVLNAITGIPIPRLRSVSRRQYMALRDEVYGDDPVAVKFRVSNTAPPWTLTTCACICGCLLVCVNHMDDGHTADECAGAEPLLSMRRILTDDMIQASNDEGINVIKLYGRISDLSEDAIAALPMSHYWPLQTAMSRAINDPLWPDEENANGLLEEWRGQSLGPHLSS